MKTLLPYHKRRHSFTCSVENTKTALTLHETNGVFNHQKSWTCYYTTYMLRCLGVDVCYNSNVIRSEMLS